MDPEIHDYLVNELGFDEDGAQDTVKEFLDTVKKCTADMDAAIPAKDFQALRTATHTLKGSSEMIRANGLVPFVMHINAAAKALDIDEAAKALAGFKIEADAFSRNNTPSV